MQYSPKKPGEFVDQNILINTEDDDTSVNNWLKNDFTLSKNLKQRVNGRVTQLSKCGNEDIKAGVIGLNCSWSNQISSCLKQS